MSVQNILTTSEKKLRSVAFGSEQAERPHSVQREVRDLREDVERAFEALESGTNAPEIHRDTLAAAANDTCGGSIKGINLLAGRGVASLVVGDLTFLGLLGEAGNNVSITINTGAGLAVAVSGTDITITLAGGGSNATQIKAAIDAHADAKKLVAVKKASGNANQTAALAKSFLTGGSGDGVSLFVYIADGTLVDLTPAITNISDTEIALNTGTALANINQNDVIAFVLKSHTVRCAPIQVTVSA